MDRTGLRIGEYTSHIVVTSNGGNSTLPVLMKVEKPPELVVSTSSLDFGEALSSKTINISNIGSGTLTWNASSGQSWISITPSSGSITTEATTITVAVSREGLSAGTHSGSVDITSNGGDRSVTVQMTVLPPPKLSVDVSSLDFGKDKTTLTFHISNIGKGSLNWEISVSKGWLTVNPQSGTITDESQEVTVIVDRSGLSPGSYGGIISITSNGGDQSVNVSMGVPHPPKLKVVPNTLNFETSLTTLTFNIINSGDGTLIWDISEDVAWLELSNYSGTTTTETDQIEVIVDRKGLPREPGTYGGTITISSATDTSVVEVTVIVPPEPTLAVSATSLDFGTEETEQTFEITNTGTGTLTWNISSDRDWITVEPQSGTTSDETDRITVTVDRRGMTLKGSPYVGTASITSDGGDGDIEVRVTVPAVPTLYCEPTEIVFGEEETVKTIQISNSGTGTLTWSLSEDIGWLTLSTTNGTTTTETDEVTLTVSRGSLAPEEYHGIINITSNGGDASITASMTVPQPPVLAVSVTSLDFGKADTALSFTITNTGGGTLEWSIASNKHWLSANPSEGVTRTEGDEITVTVDRKGLIEGSVYTGIITIASNGGEQNISVRMEVPAVPVLSVEPISLDFGEEETSKVLHISNRGTGTLTWSLSEKIDWLTVSSTSGTSASETDEVTLTVDREGLTPGEYSGVIRITSNGGDATVQVEMTVPQPPILAVNVTSLDFGTTKTVLSFEITNTGGGRLTWAISDNQDWLTVSPTNGTTRTETDRIMVTVDRSELPTNAYSGMITITSDGGDRSVRVSMTVPDTEKPTISITSPADNTTVSGVVDVTASASDNVGVTKVEFYIDGTLKSTLTDAPYQYVWDTTSLEVRDYVLLVNAYDKVANLGSDSIKVKVVRMGDIEVTGEFEDNTGNIEVTGEFAKGNSDSLNAGGIEVRGEFQEGASDSLKTGTVEVTGEIEKRD